MSFIFDNTRYLTDKGIDWAEGDITALLVSVEPVPAATAIPKGVVIAETQVPDRAFAAGSFTRGRMLFEGVPAGSKATGVVYVRGDLPVVYQTLTGAEVSSGHDEDLLVPAGEVFRL